jgi:hypothetical protein
MTSWIVLGNFEFCAEELAEPFLKSSPDGVSSVRLALIRAG